MCKSWILCLVALVSALSLALSGCQQPDVAMPQTAPPSAVHTDKGIAGIARPSSPEALALSRKIQRYAVIVGISDYKQSPRVPDLKFAARDAKAIRGFLTSPAGGGFPRGNVKLLLDREATIVNVRSAINDFLAAPVEDDLVVIYFGGHGSPDPKNPSNLYLLCHDSHPDRFGGTALPMREIDLALKYNIKSKRVIVMTDACHAAGIGAPEGRKGEVSRQAAERLNEYWRKLAASRTGITKIAASESDQISQENVRWGGGHGVFTHHLLEGLKGDADGWLDNEKDGFVTIAEAFEYLRDKVRRETRNAQCPWASPYKDHTIPVGIVDSAVQQQVAARQRAEERESTTGPEPSYTSVQVPVESDKAMALAMAYLRRAKDAEAREIVDVVLNRHDTSEPEAMAMKVDFLLQDGDVDLAEDMQLRLSVTHSGHDRARVAARLVYDYYRNQMTEQQIPDQMKILSRFVKRNPDSPHAQEATDMVAELKARLRSSYERMVAGHVKMAETRGGRKETEKARAELAQAKAAVEEALRDHGLRLDASAIDSAERMLAQAEARARYDADFEKTQSQCSRLNLLESAKAWQAFIKEQTGSPHLPQARQAFGQAKQQLQAQLQKQLDQALASAQHQVRAKQFADAQRSLDMARKAMTDAGQVDGLDLTGTEKLTPLVDSFTSESARHRDYVAYEAAVEAARQAMSRGESAENYAAAMKAHDSFQAGNASSRYVEDSRKEAEQLGAALKAWHARSYAAAMNAAQSALAAQDYGAASRQAALALTHRPGDRAALALDRRAKTPEQLGTEAALRNTTALDFTDTPIADVVAFFGAIAELNTVLDVKDAATRCVTFRGERLELALALRLVLEKVGLVYRIERDGTIYVATAERMASASEMIRGLSGSAASEMRKELQNTMNLDLLETPMDCAVPFLSDVHGGLNFVLAAKRNPPVTIKVEDLSLRRAILYLARLARLSVHADRDAIVFTDATPSRMAELVSMDKALSLAEGAQLRAALAEEISVDFADTPIGDVAAFLSDVTGIHVVRVARVNPAVTIKAHGLSLRWLLIHLAHISGLNVSAGLGVYGGRGVIVFTDATPSRMAELVSMDKALSLAEGAQLRAALAAEISVDFADTPMGDVVAFLSDVTGTSVVLVARRDATVTIRVGNRPLRWLLVCLAQVSGLNVRLEKGSIVFSDGAEEVKP